MAYGSSTRYSRGKRFSRTSYRRYRKKRTLPNVKQTNYFTPRNVASAARYAARGYNLLKGIVNAELKRYDHQVSGGVSNTYTMGLLSGTDQGDDVGNRNGNSILAKYIMYNMNIVMNASATATMVRMILFVDNENDGDTPTDAQLLQVTNTITSPINSDYTQRFTILKDMTYCLSINGDRVITDKVYRPLHFHIRYRTGTGSTGFSKNNIWLYFVSNEATNTPTLTLDSRLAFYDN